MLTGTGALLYDIGRPVGGMVIDDDHFIKGFRISLPGKGIETDTDIRFFVTRGYENGNPGGG